MIVEIEKRQWNENRDAHGGLWYIPRKKNGLRKTTRRSLRNGLLYKVKLTYFEKSFFILHARTNERDRPPSFAVKFGYMQLQSQVSFKHSSFIHRIIIIFLLWRKRKGQRVLTEFWMKEKNSQLIEIEVYMTHSCLWEMYRF